MKTSGSHSVRSFTFSSKTFVLFLNTYPALPCNKGPSRLPPPPPPFLGEGGGGGGCETKKNPYNKLIKYVC